MLLPLCRALLHRYNCMTDSGKKGYVPLDQCIKGFVGNAVVFPQADGGALVTSLPPKRGIWWRKLWWRWWGPMRIRRKLLCEISL